LVHLLPQPHYIREEAGNQRYNVETDTPKLCATSYGGVPLTNSFFAACQRADQDATNCWAARLSHLLDDGLGWNLHLLLHLWIKNPRAPSSSGNPPLYSPCRRPTRYIAVSMDPVPESKTKGQATNALAARYQGNHQHRPYAESEQIV
jgi:hypothetical protein